MIEFGPAQVYTFPETPKCPVHGPMQMDPGWATDPAGIRFVCHGFDGEGCDQVRNEPMTHLGISDGPIEFGPTWTW